MNACIGAMIKQVKETGIVLGHGSNASDYKGKLLTDVAVHLASQGRPLSSGLQTCSQS